MFAQVCRRQLSQAAASRNPCWGTISWSMFGLNGFFVTLTYDATY